MVAALGVHLALAWIEHRPATRALAGDERVYLAAAERLRGGEPLGLDPLWPPLYPRFLALLLPAHGGRGRVEIAQLALLAATAWMARDLWRRLVARDGYGDLLAVAILGHPDLAAFTHYLWPETLHLALLTFALWILVARRESWAWSVGVGIVLGLAVQTKLVLLPFLPVLLLPLALPATGRALARSALAAGALALTVAPAVAVNWREHRLLNVGDSSRFNLWVGLNDRGRSSFGDGVVEREWQAYAESAPTFRERQAILDRKIGAHLRATPWPEILRRQLGRQYFRLFDHESFLIEQLPGGRIAAAGLGYRSPSPFLAAALRAAHAAAHAALLGAAAFGILWSPRRSWNWLGLALIGFSLALYAVVHVKSRYLVQLVPLLLFYGCFALKAWREPAIGGPGRRRALGSWLAAGGAALLLFLAFRD